MEVSSLRFAGFWVRAAAYGVDLVFYCVMSYIMSYIFGAATFASYAADVIIIMLYYIVFVAYTPWQATPGKYLFKLYLRTTASSAVTPLRVLARYTLLFFPQFDAKSCRLKLFLYSS